MPLTDHRTYDQHYDPLWESDQLLLIPGEEANGSPHANPIGAVDMIVQGGTPEGRPDWWRLQTSIWDAHSQGAAWSHNHPDDGHLNNDDTPNERANAVGGDVMEVWNKASGIDRELAYAEDRWNRGYRFGVVGASDNHFRELWLVAGPGLPATHVFSANLSERGILQGLLSGRTAINARVLAAPFLTLEADLQMDGVHEAIAGDEAVAPAGTAGTLRATVSNGIGTTLSVYKSPGREEGPWQQATITAPSQTLEFDITVSETDDWYYAELRGPGEIDGLDSNELDNPPALIEPGLGTDERRAITSPIFIGPRLAAPQPETPLPIDIGADDGASRVLGEPGLFAGFPDVAVAGGVVHVVAELHGAARTAVVYRRGNGGTETAPIDLAPGSNAARFPRIAARGDQVVVVWQDERAGQIPRRPAIYLRRSEDGGLNWAPEQLVRELPGRAERPDVALTPEGHAAVVWQEIRAGQPFDVFAQVIGVDSEPTNLTRAGKTVQAANALDTRSSIYPASVWPSVAARDDGLLAVAWQDNRTDPDPLWTGSTLTGEDGATEVDNWQIQITTRRAGESWSTPAAVGNDLRADRHPALAFAGNGALVAAWDSKTLDPSGANLSVRYSISPDDGATWSDAGDPPALAEDSGTMAQYPKLGTGADGRVRAVWYDSRAADWRWRVMTAVLGDAGWQNAELILSPGINTWPATDGGVIAFASTRNAQRQQRDRTQQIFLLSP
jgi:hypothetical protein